VIAEDVEGEALATLVVNMLRGIIKTCAVKSPGFGDRCKAMLEDIAVLTGGQVIAEELGAKLDKATLAQLGRAKRIEVDKDDTILIGGAGDPAKIAARVADLREQIKETTIDMGEGIFVTTKYLNHPILCLGYRIEYEGKSGLSTAEFSWAA